MENIALRKGLLKALLRSMVCLLLIPAAAWFFTRHVEQQQDAAFNERIEKLAAARLAPPEREAAVAFYREHTPSMTCGRPESAQIRQEICPAFSMPWQFHLVRNIAGWTFASGVAVLALLMVLGALAFVNRGLQYASFIAGWRFLVPYSACAVVVQGAIGVWLSFWVTGYFFHKYWLQLVAFVGIAVIAAVWVIVRKIFQSLPRDNTLEGELITEADAPRLWERVRALAARLGTAPPDHIVAGIDNNFFVTESPMTVGDREINGRLLFVSIPLLRVMESAEAQAVLAHELAHLHGGDTRNRAALGPALVQYDHYLAALGAAGFTLVVAEVMRLYRLIFELALARDSREREFAADRVAARLVSGDAITRALVKVSAYSRYRADVERRLFGNKERLDSSLGIASAVASGLHEFAGSDDFIPAMKTADVPHPFDSHPPMALRFRNVGREFREDDFRGIVAAAPGDTWADDIVTAAAVEQRLWARYEASFAQNHERSLAYRYEPANDAERAIVLKYFPPASFSLDGGQVLEVSIEGIRSAGDDVAWDAIKGLNFQHITFRRGEFLVVTLHEKAWLRAKTVKMRLLGLKKQKPKLQEALGAFWQRHLVMRSNRA